MSELQSVPRIDYNGPPSAALDKKSATVLGNFRLLIHSDHDCAKHLQLERSGYHKRLITELRIPSTIIPPLPAITRLFSYLESSNNLNRLTKSDWNTYIFWLSHHNDHQSLSLLHVAAVANQGLGSKLNTKSYNILVNARLKVSQSGQIAKDGTGGYSSDLTSSIPISCSLPTIPQHQSLLGIFWSTIESMEKSNVPLDLNLYGSWLRTAVRERNWHEGIEAWRRLNEKAAQLAPPSIALTAYAVQCYMRTGNMSEVVRLLRLIMEKSASGQHSHNARFLQGELASNTPNNRAEVELEANDMWLESQNRQEQTLQELEALKQRSTATLESDWRNMDMLDKSYIQEWEAAVNPSLIEAICHDEEDKHAAALACDLTLDLFKQGQVLDKSQFRLLIRYIGACNGSEGAETFMKRLIELTRSISEEDSNSPANGASIKDSRKMKRSIESNSRILAEVGLQEIVKQATAEQVFDRARNIFDGMAVKKIPLEPETSEKLIVGLTKNHDYRSALAVLEKSLQDKTIPPVKTANILLQGLLRGDMLDESLAVFRELTETHEMKPDKQMYRNLMGLTSAYGQLEMTRRILSTLEALGVKREGEIYRYLMLCYVRAENLEGAIKVFETMNRVDVVYEIGHINVLLEGAVRHSTSTTIVGILEIMHSQKIHPSPETWNILLAGSLRAKDRILAQELFQELAHAVVEGVDDNADGHLRAARHPETFQLLITEYAERFGVKPALNLLKASLDAEFPSQVAPSMYLELMDLSCRQRKGVTGYKFYQMLRRSELVNDKTVRKIPQVYRKRPRSFSSPTAITSSSPSATIPSLSSLYTRLLHQLDKEGQTEIGSEMATDLILSGFEMNQDLVAASIRLYAKAGELTAAFGLFTKMNRVYGVMPSRDMVQDLYEASRAHGVLDSGSNASQGAAEIAKWDESVTQSWVKILKSCMDKLGMYDIDSLSEQSDRNREWVNGLETEK
ncbi:hypothetical protein BGZ46_005884 [Entomortierella lignicola]|nr:hypothetical protein BGZ46_005884 [Entomortierella lignicola]